MRAWAVRAVFLAWVIACAAASAEAAELPSDTDIRGMLAKRVEDQRRASGIVVGISTRAGKRIVSYGTVGTSDPTPVDGKTVFAVGSISKVLTALLLSDMAQRNEVALRDPVGTLLRPAIDVRASDGAPITLLDLATHTSGLPLRPDNLVSTDPANPYEGYTRARLLNFAARVRPAQRDYLYSNVGYGLLGEALAQRAGRPYSDLVAARITEPLGMRDTTVVPTSAMRRRLAVGYDDALAPAPAWDLGALFAAGAYYSTADDLLALLDAFLDRGPAPLRPAMHAMLDTRRPGGMSPATQIALAWNVYQRGGHEIAWKNGSVGGYRAFVGYEPATGIGVVALANAQTAGGVDDIGLHLLDPEVRVDLSLPRRFREIAVDGPTLDRYVGIYRFSETDVVTIRRADAGLTMQQPGQPAIPLFAYGRADFFLKLADVAMRFEVGKDGNAKALIWSQDGEDQRGERIGP